MRILKIGVVFAFLFIFALPAFCQEPTVIEIDWQLAETIFLTGIGGLGVTALVAIIKRAINAHGIAVVVISVIVSMGATLFVLLTAGGGFVLWKFFAYSAIVALEANGIHLIPRQRS